MFQMCGWRKNLEFYDLDSIVKIGSYSYHVKKKEITGYTKTNPNDSETTLRPELTSRWISPDPLAEEFPSWSPYNFVLNNPIQYIDPDGREPFNLLDTNNNDSDNIPKSEFYRRMEAKSKSSDNFGLPPVWAVNPIYSSAGNFRGYDDKGTGGEAIIYDGGFVSGMSQEAILSSGGMSLTDFFVANDYTVGQAQDFHSQMKRSIDGYVLSELFSPGIFSEILGMGIGGSLVSNTTKRATYRFTGLVAANGIGRIQAGSLKEFKSLVQQLSKPGSQLSKTELQQFEKLTKQFGGKLRYDLNPVKGKILKPHVQVEGLGSKVGSRHIWLSE